MNMFSNIKHIVLILPMVKSMYYWHVISDDLVQRYRNCEIVNGDSASIMNNSCFYISDFAFLFFFFQVLIAIKNRINSKFLIDKYFKYIIIEAWENSIGNNK